MIAYLFECTDCHTTSRHVDEREAAGLLTSHVCERRREGDSFVCGGCGHHVGALVDDGPLCLRCDLLEHPHPFPIGLAS